MHFITVLVLPSNVDMCTRTDMQFRCIPSDLISTNHFAKLSLGHMTAKKLLFYYWYKEQPAPLFHER